MQEYPDELEADLLEFFGVDLLDLWRGRLSIRRVGVLIKSLMKKPGRSSLLQAIDERARWSDSDYILARASDALELSNYIAIKVNAEDTRDIPFPEPLPRPGGTEYEEPAEESGPEMSSPQELIEFFGQMNSL
ncbi:hypothetical protein [Streptomyces buecherae]|uniref:hypothetical protein n=1 Tax=Streptomyces buecherae TaxID=2763006 RepID=UPI0037A0E16C